MRSPTNYDFLNHLLSAGIDRRWRRRAIRIAGADPDPSACSISAPERPIWRYAATAARPGAARVVGVDFSGAMLAVGLQKVRQRRFVQSIALVRGDATRIPLANGAVHAVDNRLWHPQCREYGAGRALRSAGVLSPGGRLAILEFAIPTMPLVRGIYLWYFNRVLPGIGRLVSRHHAAYGYLPASLAPSPRRTSS